MWSDSKERESILSHPFFGDTIRISLIKMYDAWFPKEIRWHGRGHRTPISPIEMIYHRDDELHDTRVRDRYYCSGYSWQWHSRIRRGALSEEWLSWSSTRYTHESEKTLPSAYCTNVCQYAWYRSRSVSIRLHRDHATHHRTSHMACTERYHGW